MRAHTVYFGYYIDLEKRDDGLEEGWKELQCCSYGSGCASARPLDGCQGRHERHIMNDRVSVDYDMSDDYNIFIEFLDSCTKKIQFASCPHLPPI